MTALAELQTVDLFGRLLEDEVLEPVELPEPTTWGRIAAWTVVGATLFSWAYMILPLFIQQWLST